MRAPGQQPWLICTGGSTEVAPAIRLFRRTLGPTREVLTVAAAFEADSEHPLARAIVAAAEGLTVPRATSFRAITGRGVEAEIGGRHYAVGGPALLRERDLVLPTNWPAR